MKQETQQEVDYRLGGPMTQCGCCQYYRKPTHGQFGRCARVTGRITAYGLCRRFSALNNPWGNRLTEQSRVALAHLYDKARGPDDITR